MKARRSYSTLDKDDNYSLISNLFNSNEESVDYVKPLNTIIEEKKIVEIFSYFVMSITFGAVENTVTVFSDGTGECKRADSHNITNLTEKAISACRTAPKTEAAARAEFFKKEYNLLLTDIKKNEENIKKLNNTIENLKLKTNYEDLKVNHPELLF